MTKYARFNGEYFEMHKSAKTADMINYHIKNYSDKDIYYHYVGKPSDAKINIYEMWQNWYLESDSFFNMFEAQLCMFEVTSANTFAFTIEALLYDYRTHDYIGLVRITKAHNILYLRNDIEFDFDYTVLD